MSALRPISIDRIRAACWRFPFGMGAEWHFGSPLDADRAPLIEVGMIRQYRYSHLRTTSALATGPNARVRFPLNPRILPKKGRA